MYVKIDGQLECIKKFELKSSSTIIYIHTEDGEGNLEVYKCPQTSINYKHIKQLFATDIFLRGDLECGNEQLIIWMHRLELSISQSQTNTPLNRINFNCNWTSITLEECKITNNFWRPNECRLQVRINPVENPPTVVVIPIPARTAQFANLFVTLTIASRNLATPILDTTENQRVVDLLRIWKLILGSKLGCHW